MIAANAVEAVAWHWHANVRLTVIDSGELRKYEISYDGKAVDTIEAVNHDEALSLALSALTVWQVR
ncbi:hypothetical protein GS982_01195 [Rhodococcus hoagii]|uniref:Uncharacterized protein n=1 Tax=Rhodococcus hoagii TaxID=43767 RepID=A0A9Q5EZ32_RHOHA|nr:hypothetical protein [Prescottella equi]NKT77223.1 hypothetical protein [Prescottella equi]NKZ81007.1 hypothetical protein [Prescottella equi]